MMVHSFQRRLLHPGANTSDIITQYISSVRGLRILDPRGVVLEQVCEPLRSYLRSVLLCYCGIGGGISVGVEMTLFDVLWLV